MTTSMSLGSYLNGEGTYSMSVKSLKYVHSYNTMRWTKSHDPSSQARDLSLYQIAGTAFKFPVAIV